MMTNKHKLSMLLIGSLLDPRFHRREEEGDYFSMFKFFLSRSLSVAEVNFDQYFKDFVAEIAIFHKS